MPSNDLPAVSSICLLVYVCTLVQQQLQLDPQALRQQQKPKRQQQQEQQQPPKEQQGQASMAQQSAAADQDQDQDQDVQQQLQRQVAKVTRAPESLCVAGICTACLGLSGQLWLI